VNAVHIGRKLNAQLLRLPFRALAAIALIAGIAAMHTALEAPLAASASTGEMAMIHSGSGMGAEPTTQMHTVSPIRVGTASTLDESTADATHTCLFLAAVALLLLLPPVRTKTGGAPTLLSADYPESTTSRRPINRTIALHVLRI